MAREKPLLSTSKPLKRKNLPSTNSEVNMEEMTNSKKKKKSLEEGPVQIPFVAVAADEKKKKKEKKCKMKQIPDKTKQKEISDPPSEETREPEGEEDLSPEERRVLERKMKKILKKEEKKRQKAEGETTKKTEACGPSASQQALDYLSCWTDNRTEWKFQKTRQTWLLQHMFDSQLIPDDKFSVLLHYLEGLQGGARDTTVQKALSLVEESGQAPEDSVVQQRAHRAREVIQVLS
ncbi:protein cholesin [Aulostomus maculatus]